MKLIRTEVEYDAALARIDALMSASEGTPEAEDLEVLAILVEKYEEEHYPIPDAPAFEVLKLYMEQNGLAPKDMVPYLGSPSAVSKILNGKKELSLHQVRALSKELGIPAAALIGGNPESGPEVDWTRFPLFEMARRGLFGPEHLTSTSKTLTKAAAELMPMLIKEAKLDANSQLRMRQGLRPGPTSDPYAGMAWLIEVAKTAQERKPDRPFQGLTREDLKNLGSLSKTLDGIPKAIEYLAERGVPVVIAPHYKKSKIDGGVITLDEGRPAIGLSLRYDRVDSFWFTFLHEVAHIILGHVKDFLADAYLDHGQSEAIEQEANSLVEAFTIPKDIFDQAIPKPELATLEAIIELGQRCGVSVAIAAGRVRSLTGDYRKFARLVGIGRVRAMLPPCNVSSAMNTMR